MASLALAASIGCSEPTAPRPLDGTYVLHSVGTDPVPAITSVSLGTEYWVLADTIVLQADGSGEWRSTTARRNTGIGLNDTTRTVKRFEHRRRGSVVRASRITCEPLCDVLPGEVEFVLTDDSLLLGPTIAVQRYVRAAPGA